MCFHADKINLIYIFFNGKFYRILTIVLLKDAKQPQKVLNWMSKKNS